MTATTKNLKQWEVVQTDILAGLAKVAKKHNLSFDKKGFKYGDKECTFSIIAILNDATGSKRDPKREAFIKYSNPPFTTLKADWLDKTFEERGRKYTITGFNPGRKYAVETLRDDNEVYSWTISLIVDKMIGPYDYTVPVADPPYTKEEINEATLRAKAYDERRSIPFSAHLEQGRKKVAPAAA